MKILNLRDALRLYRILSKYIDKVDEDITVLDFLSKTIGKMASGDLVTCISLFIDMPLEEVYEKYTTLEIIDIIETGFISNKVTQLMSFGWSVG